MESTQAAVRSRKSHHKSRSGCGNCKKRRIKVSDPLSRLSSSTLLHPPGHVMDQRSKSCHLKAIKVLRSLFCRGNHQIEWMESQSLHESPTNKLQCDEKKPACAKCVNHSIECDFLSTDANSSLSPSSAPQPASSKTRFKFKPSKYQSSKPSSPAASQTSLDVPRAVSSVPESQTRPETLSFEDLQLFHHFVTETYRTLADESTDNNRIWQTHVPKWGFTTPSIFHLILAMAALHQGHLNPDLRNQYVLQADAHFTFGIRSVSAILACLNAENCQLIYMSAVLICFVYFAHGPRPGEYLVFSQTGKAEWLVLMRGVRSILGSHHEKIFSGVLAIQHDPSVQEISPSLRDELREHAARMHDVRVFIGAHVGAESGIYMAAIDNLLEMFEESYRTCSAGKGGVGVMSHAIGWIYRRPEEFICLLEERDPYALIILAYWCVLLKLMGSSWMMIGWDRHVIGGIQSCLSSEYHQWIEWPVRVICE
ncbi:unnamed protein product [Penicillium salamii]|nr:unnamed protein product [Penicillium salamii]